jgi:hypothetical protein
MRTAPTCGVVNRGVQKEEVRDVVQRCIELGTEYYNEGKYPHLEQVFTSVIKSKYEQHTVAEWGRNILEAMEIYRDEDADFEMVGSILATTAGSHILLHRTSAAAESARAMSDLRRRVAGGEENKDKEQKKGKEDAPEVLPASDLLKELASTFPTKPQAHIDELSGLLQGNEFSNHGIDITAFGAGTATGPSAKLMELLLRQFFAEHQQYASELRTGLTEEASRRKSKKSEMRVSPEELQKRIIMIEQAKPNDQVAVMVYRGFNMASQQVYHNPVRLSLWSSLHTRRRPLHAVWR